MRRDAWTPEEIERLRELYPAVGAKETARLLGRKLNAVKSKAIDLGIRGDSTRPRFWTADRDGLLRTSYAAGGLAAAREALGTSRSAVKNRVQQLGLKRPPKLWSAEEHQFIRDHYGVDMTAEE